MVNIYLWVLLISSLIGFAFIIQNKPFTYLHTLPIFLLYLYGVEQFSNYLVQQQKENIWLFNYSSVTEICYYTWLISKMYKLKKYCKTIDIIRVVYCLIALVNIIFFQGKKGFHTITFGLGSLFLIACCIYYFYQLLLFPNRESLLKKMEFWVSTAILFSFSCGFPIFCLTNIYYNNVSAAIWPIILNINLIINIIYYSLFAIAFLSQIKIKKQLTQ